MAASADVIAAAPPKEEFQRVLDHVQKHSAAAGVDGISGVAGHKKIMQYIYCLALGSQRLDQEFIKSATGMCLIRDARKGKLCVRFAMVDDNLKVRRGILGIARGHGSTAEDTVEATSKIFDEFSTVVLRNKRKIVNANVRSKMRKICKVMVQDSAGDEVLAAEIQRRKLVRMMEPLTPNVRACPVCKCRGGRRILTRPWHADARIREIVINFAYGRILPAQLVQHSPDLRAEFKKVVKGVHPDIEQHCENLRAAKHRFESLQQPLGRTCRYFLACHALMLRVACKRAGKPAQRAKQWLTWVAQSPQHTFMRALLADAADESMLVIRSFDTETFDVSAIASHIRVFL
ncbi:unnamed protein product, partial [Prorocentrum cordatum]